MKILIYTFSGTGNTFLTADYIAGALREKGVSVDLFKIEDIINNDENIKLDGVSHILIGYPIHAFNSPKIVVDFSKKLPSSSGQKVSIFKTSGEPFFFNNSSSHILLKQLRLKGYDFLIETHFLMPYNIMFRYPDSLVKQMFILMQQMAGKYADDIISEKGEGISYTMLNKLVSFVLRIQWGGARLNGRLYSCKHKKCTLCMKCVNNCPSQNIRVENGRIRFDGKCLMCMRCVQNCNFNAINIGILRFWAVRGKYDFESISTDELVSSKYINENTHGYFKLFRRYFIKNKNSK